MKRARGFTIIEIITVVLIISILASIVIAGYNITQGQARDGDRKSDALLLKHAIMKYYDDNGTYPLPSGCVVNSGCSASLLSTLLVPTYLPSIPATPKGTAYAYIRGTDAEDSFALLITMESTTTCKTGAKINTSWWGAGVPTCSF